MKIEVKITDKVGNIHQYVAGDSLPTDEYLKFAEWCINNGVTTYYNEDSGGRFIDNDNEVFFDISQIYDKFKTLFK